MNRTCACCPTPLNHPKMFFCQTHWFMLPHVTRKYINRFEAHSARWALAFEAGLKILEAKGVKRMDNKGKKQIPSQGNSKGALAAHGISTPTAPSSTNKINTCGGKDSDGDESCCCEMPVKKNK